ncbi:MAG: DNA repair protein RecN [Legionellales bacterium]|nr:DNA repair protein RecN [Legionellales bacterium]|tara:strand:+ start:13036 stop:14700 length:1665 start_codon:yes stop_codon:yes gene_type:complete
MLCHIHIKDFAIIENLDLELRSGMTVITGETGAGKSIIIDALDVALGDRADSKLVRQGAERSEINITFDVKHIPEAREWLAAKELSNDDELILRRLFTAEGRSRNYINGNPATLQQIRELGRLLIHTHGQHEHQALFRRDAQRRLLDNFANHNKLLDAVAEIYQHWQRTNTELEQLRNLGSDSGAQLELLIYQANELDQLALAEGELEQLHSEHQQLANADRLIHACNGALDLLSENTELNAQTALQNAAQTLNEIAELDPHISSAGEMINNAIIHCEEASSEIRHYLAQAGLDPERLHTVEQRLSQIHDIARKHRVKAEELCAHQTTLQQQLDTLKNSDERVQELLAQEQALRDDYRKAAKKLHNSRIKAAKKLNQLTTDSMQMLGMEGGKIAIEINHQDNKEPTNHGLDAIEFLVAANPGQSLQPLAKVASGGELSRISLAIQVITAQLEATPTLVFDEVDVGIGGSTAEVVGKLLRQLGDTAQVLCITHLPQVAAQGHHHLMIDKFVENDLTRSRLTFLDNEQRINEIARMLGGVKITQQTLAHAEEMLAL